MHYLEQKRTIILAVVPSNADIATSEILQMAQEVDPDGERTVGVLTKPDLVDKGAEDEVMEVLMNQRKELKHGYYMLKNRSQEALKANMSLEEAHKEEMLYFQKSRYADAQSRLGVDALSTALTELLVERIKAAIPELNNEVQRVLEDTEQRLGQLGTAPPETPKARRLAAHAIITEIVRNLRHAFTQVDSFTEESGTSVIRQERHFRKDFAAAVLATKPAFDEGGEYRRNLCTQIEEKRSRELPGFMSWHLFCSLVCNYVEQWKASTFSFQQAVRESTVNATRTFIRDAEHFPHLHSKMDALLDAYFKDTVHAATSQLDRLLDVEKAPSTENHYLWDTINKIRNDRTEKQIMAMSDAVVYDNGGNQQRRVGGYVKKTEVTAMLKSTLSGNTSNESQEVQDMLDMLSAYWKVAAKRYIDEVGSHVTNMYTNPDQVNYIEKRLQEYVLECDDDELSRKFV